MVKYGARLAQYAVEGKPIHFCILCNNVYDGLDWMRENVQSQGIAIFSGELKPKIREVKGYA